MRYEELQQQTADAAPAPASVRVSTAGAVSDVALDAASDSSSLSSLAAQSASTAASVKRSVPPAGTPAQRYATIAMGRHQRAEAAGLIAFLACAVLAYGAMSAYLSIASAIWLVSQRLFIVGAGMVAACAVASFIAGYVSIMRTWHVSQGVWVLLRGCFEVVSLSIVYAATVFLTMFAMLSMVNMLLGRALVGYLPAACSVFAGVLGYVAFVQAQLLDAKTVATLLPFFMIAGIATAGLTSDDPVWYRNNFSQLGDRNTLPAQMFNTTLILAGVCVIIVSYFAVSELVSTYRTRGIQRHKTRNNRNNSSTANIENAENVAIATTPRIRFFALRMVALGALLVISGITFIGIGSFQYTPYPFWHNLFARLLPVSMSGLLVGLPWLAPQFSRTMYVISDIAMVIIWIEGYVWMSGGNTLTNVEALTGLVFLGWCLVFSRHIAALEADRIELQLSQHIAV